MLVNQKDKTGQYLPSEELLEQYLQTNKKESVIIVAGIIIIVKDVTHTEKLFIIH